MATVQRDRRVDFNTHLPLEIVMSILCNLRTSTLVRILMGVCKAWRLRVPECHRAWRTFMPKHVGRIELLGNLTAIEDRVKPFNNRLWNIFARFASPTLSKLHLRYNGISTKTISSMIRQCRSLEIVELDTIVRLEDQIVNSLIQLLRLQSLTLQRCGEITGTNLPDFSMKVQKTQQQQQQQYLTVIIIIIVIR
ncbi:hypothetical protein BDB00DRAFT_791352 [Zychaea mexicana]|uniref:uncharacterized protein n=1 Tax=Zychaea mexicana TaxID=64656 RepID=UPI0022FDCC4E|nr:uncharacterized protein BDB00DRAFT_791352 [Zychaea mexicana]KAI9489099.1 hypothetical protein BDB00DRAFT_791352 [Zychaea mexicana]